MGVSGTRVTQELGMHLTALPIKYLGSFLYKGISRAAYCTSLIDHVRTTLNSWSSKLLSMAGRVILIRHVLCSMPLHGIVSSRLPKSVLDILNQKMSQFLWNGRHHWKSWDHICRPKENGGLDIRSLRLVQQAYDFLLWWKYHHSQSLWAEYMWAKYGRYTLTFMILLLGRESVGPTHT